MYVYIHPKAHALSSDQLYMPLFDIARIDARLEFVVTEIFEGSAEILKLISTHTYVYMYVYVQ